MSEDFVIDTSVVMSWCFKDETNRYADAILESNVSLYDNAFGRAKPVIFE